jgi:type I restriction enzyme R subunit
MEKVRDGQHDDTPAAVRSSDLAKAFFGALKEQLPGFTVPDEINDGSVHEDQAPYGGQPVSSRKPASVPELLAGVACDIEAIIRAHAVVRWRDNTDAQNRMRNDLDDLLFSLQREKDVKLTYEQMDAIIESILRIARNRSDV